MDHSKVIDNGRVKKSAEPRLLRWAHAMGFAAYLSKIGVPVEKYYKQQGLPTLCDDPNAFVPLQKVWAYWDAVARNEDPLLGWHVGHFYGDHLLSSGLLRKIEHAPTLYQALHYFVRLIGIEASHLQLGIHERKNDILFYTHYPDIKDAPGYVISQTYQLEAFIALVRHYAGPSWLPQEVGVEVPAISPCLEEHLDVRFVTNRQKGYITVPRSCLHLNAPREGEAIDDEQSLMRADRLSYMGALGTMLKAYLADGYPSARLAASLMDTSERSLHRRLSQFGLSYGAIVDEVRFNKAKELLVDPDIRIIDVARYSGFDDASNFSRMFRRVGGLAPNEYRMANLISEHRKGI